MKIETIKTKKVIKDDKIEDILNCYLPTLRNRSILAVTSKIISICEGRVRQLKNETGKASLIRKEADLCLPKENHSDFYLTIKNNVLIPNAGIDESNGNGSLILWPKDPWKSAMEIRSYLIRRDKLKDLGVIVTDSKTTPLRSGTTGFALAVCGFEILRDYIGTTDLFGRKFEATKANLADGLAAAAVAVMGEGSEQTPLAVISELGTTARFCNKKTDCFTIKLNDDLYYPLLSSKKWHKAPPDS